MEPLYQIYDKACKRCLSLSKRSTVLLINGLYDKNYPLDSEVTYHWTEHTDEDLHRTLADTIITINHTDSYHIEIQMYPDQEIVMRVFEYGYHHAVQNRNGQDILVFPSPKILYLYENGNAPEFHELTIDFGIQGIFTYRVPTFRYLKMGLEELKKRKLIVLIPFQLLRLRKAIEKERTPENIQELKSLIHYDIINSIRENVAAGNISSLEGQKLQRITLQLYSHIYEKYEEIEKAGVNKMAEEALILDIDIIEQELRKEITKQVREELTQQMTKEVTQQVTKEVTQKMTQQKEEFIKNLISQLKELNVSDEKLCALTGMSLDELQIL